MRKLNVLSLLLIVAMLVSATPTLSYIVYEPGYFIVRMKIIGTPPSLNITVLTPAPLTLSHINATKVNIDINYYIMRSMSKVGEGVAVSYKYKESYQYEYPVKRPCQILTGFINGTVGRVESKVYMSGSNEVLRHVKIEVESSKNPIYRMVGYSITYVARAEFYGEDFEGLSISEVRERAAELLEPELSVVIPHYVSDPNRLPRLSYLFGNRTVEVQDVEYVNGRYYVTFNITDSNRVLPVITNMKLEMRELCSPELGTTYKCNYYAYVRVSQFISHTILLELDRIYDSWLNTVYKLKSTEGLYERRWKEEIVPIERDMLFLTQVILLMPKYFPQDPFLWITILDLVRTGMSPNVTITTSTTIEDLTIENLIAKAPKPIDTATWYIKYYPRVPIQIIISLPYPKCLDPSCKDKYLGLLDRTAYIVYSLGGYRLPYVIQNLEKLVRTGDRPRYYFYIPETDTLIVFEDLYNATLTVPVWDKIFEDYCKMKEEPYGETKLLGDTCLIIGNYLPTWVVGVITDFLHPPTPTETPAEILTQLTQTTAIASRPISTSTSVLTPTPILTLTPTQSVTPKPTITTSYTSPKPTTPLATEDIIYMAMAISVIVLATTALITLVKKK